MVLPASLATAFTAAGQMDLSGRCRLSDGVAEVLTALEASGGFRLSAPAVAASVLPGSLATEFAATIGQLELSGRCQVGDGAEALGTVYAAARGFSLSGFCQVASVLPGSLATDFAGAGQFDLSGRCQIVTGEALETAFVTSGGYSLSATSRLDTTDLKTFVAAYGATGGIEIGGTFVLVLSAAPPVSAFAGAALFLLGGRPSATFLSPLVMAMAAAGGYVIPPTDMTVPPGMEEIYEAWVLTGQAFEPSIFSNFKFNSFAQRGTQTFAAGEDGIYILDGDDTDDGETIHSGARIGPINFGTDREKRIRPIHIGNCGLDTKVRVVAENGERIFTPNRDSNRVVVSSDLQGREFTIDVADFEELCQFEITPLILARR